jgi:hypothetical protein
MEIGEQFDFASPAQPARVQGVEAAFHRFYVRVALLVRAFNSPI